MVSSGRKTDHPYEATARGVPLGYFASAEAAALCRARALAHRASATHAYEARGGASEWVTEAAPQAKVALARTPTLNLLYT